MLTVFPPDVQKPSAPCRPSTSHRLRLHRTQMHRDVRIVIPIEPLVEYSHGYIKTENLLVCQYMESGLKDLIDRLLTSLKRLENIVSVAIYRSVVH